MQRLKSKQIKALNSFCVEVRQGTNQTKCFAKTKKFNVLQFLVVRTIKAAKYMLCITLQFKH